MRTQTKILGTIDILIGAYLLWIFGPLYESIANFIQREFTLTVFLAGLIIGGVGLWSKRKAGWIANQMTGIHIILSAIIGMIVTNNNGIGDSQTIFLFSVLILLIGTRLFWTNKQQWLDEFNLSNKSRLLTISLGTIISLVLLLKSHV